MTPVSIASVAASLLSLVLSVWFVITSLQASSVQESVLKGKQDLNNKQKTVGAQEGLWNQQGQKIQQLPAMRKQIGGPIVQGIAQAAVQKKNDKLIGLLKKYGIEVRQTTPTPAADGAAASPKPAKPVGTPTPP